MLRQVEEAELARLRGRRQLRQLVGRDPPAVRLVGEIPPGAARAVGAVVVAQNVDGGRRRVGAEVVRIRPYAARVRGLHEEVDAERRRRRGARPALVIGQHREEERAVRGHVRPRDVEAEIGRRLDRRERPVRGRRSRDDLERVRRRRREVGKGDRVHRHGSALARAVEREAADAVDDPSSRRSARLPRHNRRAG